MKVDNIVAIYKEMKEIEIKMVRMCDSLDDCSDCPLSLTEDDCILEILSVNFTRFKNKKMKEED